MLQTCVYRSERKGFSRAFIQTPETCSMSVQISSASVGPCTIQRRDLKRMQVNLIPIRVHWLSGQQANIELFRSFLPQLCYRSPSSSHDAIAKLVGGPGEFVMEEKLDGERMQLHMRGSGAQWCYWSRKAKDYSEHDSHEARRG